MKERKKGKRKNERKNRKGTKGKIEKRGGGTVHAVEDHRCSSPQARGEGGRRTKKGGRKMRRGARSYKLVFLAIAIMAKIWGV